MFERVFIQNHDEKSKNSKDSFIIKLIPMALRNGRFTKLLDETRNASRHDQIRKKVNGERLVSLFSRREYHELKTTADDGRHATNAPHSFSSIKQIILNRFENI